MWPVVFLLLSPALANQCFNPEKEIAVMLLLPTDHTSLETRLVLEIPQNMKEWCPECNSAVSWMQSYKTLDNTFEKEPHVGKCGKSLRSNLKNIFLCQPHGRIPVQFYIILVDRGIPQETYLSYIRPSFQSLGSTKIVVVSTRSDGFRIPPKDVYKLMDIGTQQALPEDSIEILKDSLFCNGPERVHKFRGKPGLIANPDWREIVEHTATTELHPEIVTPYDVIPLSTETEPSGNGTSFDNSTAVEATAESDTTPGDPEVVIVELSPETKLVENKTGSEKHGTSFEKPSEVEATTESIESLGDPELVIVELSPETDQVENRTGSEKYLTMIDVEAKNGSAEIVVSRSSYSWLMITVTAVATVTILLLATICAVLCCRRRNGRSYDVARQEKKRYGHRTGYEGIVNTQDEQPEKPTENRSLIP